MSLNRYILASIFFHLILISLITVVHPVQKNNVSVFNVTLLEPLDIQHSQAVPEEAKPESKESPLIRKKMPPKRYRDPESIETQRPLETIPGDDTVLIQPSDNVEVFRGPTATEDNEIKDSGTPPSENTKSVPYTSLFDRETIEKFAKRLPSDDKKGLSFDAPEFRYRGYMRMLKQRIESIWTYPEEAVRQGLSGDLYIRFSINRDGSLGKVELIRTSGYRSLDEAAMKAVSDAQPFWPLPDDWQKDTLVINGHFIYILGKTVIM